MKFHIILFIIFIFNMPFIMFHVNICLLLLLLFYSIMSWWWKIWVNYQCETCYCYVFDIQHYICMSLPSCDNMHCMSQSSTFATILKINLGYKLVKVMLILILCSYSWEMLVLLRKCHESCHYFNFFFPFPIIIL
jgi:hypothetical protein